MIRKGSYERDQRSGAIRFAAAADQPGGIAASLDTFGPDTVLRRGTHLKIRGHGHLHLQSDLSTSFEAAGFKHQLLAGIDLAREEKTERRAQMPRRAGWTSASPHTTVGTPGDGAWVDEASRVLRKTSDFESTAWGRLGAQGRWSRWLLTGSSLPVCASTACMATTTPIRFRVTAGPVTTAEYEQSIYKWSKRFGVLYQPNALQSFQLLVGTSFNTSGATPIRTTPPRSILRRRRART